LPAIDLAAPGWQVRHGQAVWTPGGQKSEIAGELLVAQHPDGDCAVQFTKPPFVIAEARVSDARWHLELGSGKKAWRGTREPPARIVWFQLPRALTGSALDGRWSWTRPADGPWTLINRRTGERLEGRFRQ
jgi:hypothetical protein